MTETAYLALGSNMGEAKQNLDDAVAALGLVPGIKVESVSSYYITKPWGVENQPDFVNACLCVKTSLSPQALLGVCLGIEAGMGRVRMIKNGPRIIDIDVLLYNDIYINTDELILPHPRMAEREFVLVPLLDIAKDGKVLNFDIKKALSELKNSDIDKGSSDTPGSVLKSVKKD
ncbi:MAG: 2-amino-4-hydroxy-6-hydroxymethyldihydropteridine diphosphokinase [Clostridia bacterium]|nr:2-amino-4-hydroxy-6-hydroxymethyldihydropteridine diphosphokinase [Clostridia bacterium]